MFTKLKQFKDIRARAKTLQDTLAKETVEGSGAWGKAKVRIDGNMKVNGVSLDPSLLADKAACENGVRDAVNDAVGKIQKILATKMKDFGGTDLAKDVQDLIK